MTSTFAPCFINGETKCIVVGGNNGEGMEIWDVANKKAIQVLKIDDGWMACSTSTNNILAVCSSTGIMQL